MRRPYLYILQDGEPVPVDNIIVWAEWFEDFDRRRIALDEDGDVRVSTVFIGIDTNFMFGGSRLLYETMIFGGPCDHARWKWATRDVALRGHHVAVVMAGLGPLLGPPDITSSPSPDTVPSPSA